MDLVSAIASIATLLQLSGAVIKYLSGVKDASDDIRLLIIEISTVRGLLLAIKEVIAEDSILLELLNQRDKGLFYQIDSLLESLATKLGLGTKQSAQKWSKKLRWPLQKEDIKGMLLILERQKALLSLALQHDHMCDSPSLAVHLNLPD